MGSAKSDAIPTPLAGPTRIVSLDQFRGYTVVGMFLVNFVGGFDAIKTGFPLLKHWNTYCSYADTIMPQFFFAVGFAFRLTFLRRLQIDGAAAAYSKAVRRNLGLILLGIVVYRLQGNVHTWSELTQLTFVGFLKNAFFRDPFETLVHIGVTSLWILTVIAGPPAARIVFAILSAGIHLILSSRFYYEWVQTNSPIDGGPLGFMTWTIPTIAGTLACDAVMSAFSSGAGRLGRAALRIFGWGIALMVFGYAISCLNRVTPPNEYDPSEGWKSILVEPPFVPPTRPVNIWTMSQRAGASSYQMFGAGLSLAIYALFIGLSDLGGLRIGVFRTFGNNALAGYLIHSVVADAIHPYAPRDAPLWFVWAAFGLFMAICYLFVRHLEKHKLFLRL